ncbi:MAG: DUF262 domain-containing protein [Muribaculum sp.]|nr:DUF262 domain-containing protein [Muribaculum sp.]
MNLFDLNISIPQLQRDYVQGAHQNKIIPFIRELIDVSCAIDLNYIYGTMANESTFQPIDGQQRLTTIWLIRLCLNKALNKTFTVHLNYSAREFANDFSEKLLTASVEDLKNPQHASWYIRAWDNDPSIRAMCSTLEIIWENFPTDINKILNIYNTFDQRIKYCYLPLGEDINEDVYIKMNRRGLQLTAFENLKAWLDKKVEQTSICKEWKQNMDGKWANMMWDILDKSDTNVDLSIDDLMLNCLYSFAHIYLSKNKEAFNNYFEEEANFNIDKDARFLLGLDEAGNIADACLNRIGAPSDKMRFALYELDSIPIFTTDSLIFIMECMNKLSETYTLINNSTIQFFPKSNEEYHTLVERLINSNTYLSRTLLYALCAFNGSEFTAYDMWMYRIRNLVVNTEINASTIENVIAGIDSLKEQCESCSIDNVLRFTKNAENDIIELPHFLGFSKDQLREECLKSQLREDVRKEVEQTENHPFFLGHISFLFDFAGEQPSLEEIIPYTFYMTTLFGDESFAAGIGNFLRFAMFSYGWFGYRGEYGNWSFLKSLKEKKKFIYDNQTSTIELHRDNPHNFVLKYVIDDLYKQNELSVPTGEMLKSIGVSQYNKLENNDERFYYSDIRIWNYMGQHQLRDISSTKQYLFEKTKGNCNHINLWNYFLYCSWIDEHEKLFPGWNFNKWNEGDNSCVYLDKQLFDNSKLAIDIWHDDLRYGWYNLSIFFREDKDKTSTILGPILENLSPQYILQDDRFVTTESVSLDTLKDYLKIVIEILSIEVNGL